MKKFDLLGMVGAGGNFAFLYINSTILIESAQVFNLVINGIGSIGSLFLISIKISKYIKEKMKK